MDNAESTSTNTLAPDQAVPMIDGIPEEYFRAFIGKNADYYLNRFKEFENVFRNGGGAVQLVRLLVNVNWSAFGLNILFPHAGFYIYRKLWLPAIIFIVVEQIRMLIYCFTSRAFAQILYFILLILTSLSANLLYYVYCKRIIKRIVFVHGQYDAAILLKSIGGTSVKSFIIIVCVLLALYSIIYFLFGNLLLYSYLH